MDSARLGRCHSGSAAFEISPYLNYINHNIYGFLRGDTIQNFPVRQFTATDVVAAKPLTFAAECRPNQ
jgi:hypothetical protein